MGKKKDMEIFKKYFLECLEQTIKKQTNL